MKLFGLHEGFYEGVEQRIELVTAACKAKGLEFVCIDSLTFDYTTIPTLTKRDLLYNLARGSAVLESLLLNDDVTTFYIKNPKLTTFRLTPDWSIIHQKALLQAPRTIYHLTNNRALLGKYVEHLGGFPLIVKVRGGTRGIGTIKIESWQSLVSTIDYLLTTGDSFMLREFIDAEYGARIIVLGEETIWSNKFYFQDSDFRNASPNVKTRYEPLDIDDETRRICVEAVRSANLEMAGVDILFDRNRKPYLLEINFPTGFGSFNLDPGFVLSRMLGHLIEKSKGGDG